MATAKKLPSGKYRVRLFTHKDSNGKKHYKSFTAATKKEAELMALNYKIDSSDSTVTVWQAVENYCTLKSAVLSPTTIKGYLANKKIMEPIADIKLSALTQQRLQRYINDISQTHAPKTVMNVNALMSAILKSNGFNTFTVTLPQRQSIVYNILSRKELKKVLEYTKQNDFDMYLAISLGSTCMMRRSEICGLMASDICGNIAHTKTVLVQDKDNTYVTKKPKTVESDRYIQIPDKLLKELPKSGRIVNLNPNQITHRYRKYLNKLGIPPSRFHDLRHFGSSMLHALGVPDQYIMKQGGWKSDRVLKAVYRNTLPDYEKTFAKKANSAYNSIL